MEATGAIPDVIDGYPVLSRLGSGASAVVYRVQDPHSGKALALKLMVSLENAAKEDLARFEREVEIASSLSHPNLVRLQGSGMHQSIPYLLMDLVEGPSLQQIVASPERLTNQWRRRVFELGTPLFGALQHIHNRRILHRDIKPENVIVADGTRPMLVDFGLAESQSRETPEREGTIKGTLGYISPELFEGQDADRRTDLFALGVVLMEMIAGRLPYEGQGLTAIVGQLLRRGPLRLRDLVPSAPADLDTVLARMTARQPGDRYFTAAEAYYDWFDAARDWCGAGLEEAPVVEASTYDLVLPEMVGRVAELDRLNQLRDNVQVSSLTTVVVEGTHGIGRSRLIDHWLRRVPDGTVVLRARAVPEHATPYGPWLQPLRDVLAQLPEATRSHFRLLPMLLSQTASAPHQGSMDDSPTAEKISLHEEVRAALRALAEQTSPLVLVIENVDDADAETIELLSYLAHHPHPPPHTMMVLSTAAGALDALPAERLRLGPLSAEALARLAESAVGLPPDRHLPEVVHLSLLEASKGLPQAASETLNAWLLAGVLRQVRQAWVWDATAYQQWAADPDDVGDRLVRTARQLLDGRSEAARRILAAMVVGQGGFGFEELTQVTGESARRVLDVIEDLTQQAVVALERRGYVFCNRDLRAALHQALSVAERVTIQRSWIDSLIRDPRPSTEKVFRLVALCDDTVDWSPAAPALSRAAEQAMGMYGYDLAWRILHKLVAEVRRQGDTDAEYELTLRAGEAGRLAGRHDDVGAMIDGLLPRMRADRQHALLRLKARTLYDQGAFAASMAVWEEAARSLGLPVPDASLGGTLQAVAGLLRALIPGLASRRLASQAERIEPLLDTCYGIIHANYFLADPKQQNLILYIIAVVIQIAKTTRRPDLAARSHFLLSYFCWMLPRPWWGGMRANAEKSVQAAMAHGTSELQIGMARDNGYLFTQAGLPQRGVALTDEGLRIATDVSDVNGQAWHLQVGAYVRRWTGALDEAEACLVQAQVAVDTLRHGRLGIATRQELAYIQTWLGSFDAAEANLATPIPYETPTPLDDLQGNVYRGWLRLRQGRWKEAQDLLRKACQQCLATRSGLLWYLQAAYGWTLALADEAHAEGCSKEHRQDLADLARKVRSMGELPPLLQIHRLLLRAEVAAVNQRHQAAEHDMHVAWDLAQHHGFGTDAAWALQRWALMRRRRGATADDLLASAIEAWRKTGAARQADRLTRLSDLPASAPLPIPL